MFITKTRKLRLLFLLHVEAVCHLFNPIFYNEYKCKCKSLVITGEFKYYGLKKNNCDFWLKRRLNDVSCIGDFNILTDSDS